MRKGTPRFHPMPGKVAVRLLDEQVQGGLILPTTQQRVIGEIIAIGGDEDDGDLNFPVTVGDVVMFGQNSGVKVSMDELVTEHNEFEIASPLTRRVRHEVLIFRTAEILCRVTWHDASDPAQLDALENDDAL